MNPKIIFFGNTKYSVLGLEIINKKFPIILAVTIPDKPSGRKRVLTLSPVKKFAQENQIDILETDILNDESVKKIDSLNPDFLVVEDYGLILPTSILEIPKYAPLNIHHSLLPKYRGPSPAPAAILSGDKETGVTIIQMTEIVDAGDMLAQKKYDLRKNETTETLLTTLNKMGGELIIGVIEDYLKGKENPIPQDDKQSTHTSRLTKQDGFIDIANPPDKEKLDRMIRAYFPWPTVWTKIDGKIIKFLPEGKIQPEGKKPMTLKEFANGYVQYKDQMIGLLD